MRHTTSPPRGKNGRSGMQSRTFRPRSLRFGLAQLLLTLSYMPGFASVRYAALALLVGCGGIDVSSDRASTRRIQGERATSDCSAILESGANDPGTDGNGCSTPLEEAHCWLAVPDGGFGERALTTQASAFTA